MRFLPAGNVWELPRIEPGSDGVGGIFGIRTRRAVTTEGRRNTCACRMLMSADDYSRWMDVDDAVDDDRRSADRLSGGGNGRHPTGDTVVVFGPQVRSAIWRRRCAWLSAQGEYPVTDHIEYRLEFARDYAPSKFITIKNRRCCSVS
jgi:hypothetical protein